MVLGICSLVFPFFGVVTAVIGLILGIVATSKQKAAGASSGMAVAGIICSVIGLVANIILIVACYGLLDTVFNRYGNYGNITEWFDWY